MRKRAKHWDQHLNVEMEGAGNHESMGTIGQIDGSQLAWFWADCTNSLDSWGISLCTSGRRLVKCRNMYKMSQMDNLPSAWSWHKIFRPKCSKRCGREPILQRVYVGCLLRGMSPTNVEHTGKWYTLPSTVLGI